MMKIATEASITTAVVGQFRQKFSRKAHTSRYEDDIMLSKPLKTILGLQDTNMTPDNISGSTAHFLGFFGSLQNIEACCERRKFEKSRLTE